MAFAEGRRDREDIRRGGASVQAADVRFLNGGAVGHRVGEGHTKFNDIRATRDQRIEIGCGVAVTRSDEGDERGVRLGKGGGEAGPATNPSSS